MKTLLSAVIILAFSTSVRAEAPKKADRWTELNKLVSQEMKILENARRKGPELYYRMLELHSEKLKLLHEKNNKEFMAKSKAANVSKQKESFFKETRDYYQFTKILGTSF